MKQPFSALERAALLSEYFAATAQLVELTAAYDAVGEDEADSQVGAELLSAQTRVSELSQRYQQGLPVVPLSRCPFTGQELALSIDTFGLDGLWWNYELPVRPLDELPRTFFALTGALKLVTQVERFPFVCCTGPEAPYVVPRLLQHPEIKAVVSVIEVGHHQGYLITYFADPVLHGVPRVNTWGIGEYRYRDVDGQYRWWSVAEPAEDFDFDLEPWVRAGKLLWIAPGDTRLTLNADVRRCPYLALSGRRSATYVQEGVVWTHEYRSNAETGVA